MPATGDPAERREAVAGEQPLTEVLRQKLLLIVHRACCEIRSLSRTDQAGRIFDLADTVEFIPEEMRHWHPDSLVAIHGALHQYQQKYPRMGVDYLAVLEMRDGDFHRTYIDPPPPDLNDPEVREFIDGPVATECPGGKDKHQ